jgi:hypothetical protein
MSVNAVNRNHCRGSAGVGISCWFEEYAEVKNVIAGIVLAAGLIVVLAVSLRRRYIFRGWQSWPTAEATVEAAEAAFASIVATKSTPA